MAKKSSIFSTVASATMVQKGSPATSVSTRRGSCPISLRTVEMLRNFSTMSRTFPGLQFRTSRITYIDLTSFDRATDCFWSSVSVDSRR